MIYLSGINPSLPFTDPLHQSPETCLNKLMESPFRKSTSRDERALKSYSACAVMASDSRNIGFVNNYTLSF